MEKFTVHTGTAAVLRASNVDTDQIIPAVYLKRITKTGFADGLFRSWRDHDPDFVLNDPRSESASILIAGAEFGTGSSREHAVWALRDWGFKAVVAPSFGDIFRGNSLKEGLLPIELPGDVVEELQDTLCANPDATVAIDVNARTIVVGEKQWPFPLDDFSQTRLIEGLDDIDVTLRAEDQISAYEVGRAHFLPSLTHRG
jgi:3-isopropylmalate/(R)-2-methylmalate dehydratase small subunit